MHIVFRGFAQKMGMQNIRAILDEDIDICLNTAIIETVRTILQESVPQDRYSERLIRQNLSVSPINALRTLYSELVVNAESIDTLINPILGETINTEDIKEVPASETNPYIITFNSFSYDLILHLLGVKVSYINNTLYDCRIIEAEDLGSVMRDYCNRPTYDAPVATMINGDVSSGIRIYTGCSSKANRGKSNFRKPEAVHILYIKKPAEVKYNKHNPADNINCDLPVYLHDEVVMKAANVYMASINAGSNNSNNQQK